MPTLRLFQQAPDATILLCMGLMLPRVMAAAELPSNDKPIGAITLPAGYPSVTASFEGATIDSGEVNPGNQFTGSLWWRWSALVSGRVLIQVSGSHSEPYVILYGPSAPGHEESVILANQTVRGLPQHGVERSYLVRAGAILNLQVLSREPQSVDLSLTPLPAPPNDDPSTATELPDTAVGAEMSILGATPDTQRIGWPSGNSLWWRWQPPADGIYQIDTANSDFQPSMVVADANARPQFLPIPPISPELLDGVTGAYGCRKDQPILIGFFNTSDQGGTLRFSLHRVTPPRPPSNDSFANATILQGPAIEILTQLRHATREAGEPGGSFEQSIWYRWTPPQPGPYLLSGPRSRGSLPSRYYTGSSLDTLVPIPVLWDDGAASLAFLDKTLWIQCIGNAPAIIHLRIDPVGPPPNDLFADAVPLPLPGDPIPVTTLQASVEPGEPLIEEQPEANHTVWFQFVPPKTTVARFHWRNVTKLMLRFYLGTEIQSLNRVPLTQDASTSTSNPDTLINVTGGARYWVQVLGEGKGALEFLEWSLAEGSADVVAAVPSLRIMPPIGDSGVRVWLEPYPSLFGVGKVDRSQDLLNWQPLVQTQLLFPQVPLRITPEDLGNPAQFLRLSRH